MGEKACFMEYLRKTASAIYRPEELFRKFLKTFLKTSKKTPLKKTCFNNDEDSSSGNFLKTQWYRVKTMTYVACMLKIISLTRTPYSHEFVANLAECFLFMSKVFFGFIYWIQHINFFVSKREPYPEPWQTSNIATFLS